jgi:hypothetical protein
MNRRVGDRAVVLGASMAGLLAARVLTDVYGQVTVIDRDELAETAMHRRGVPHGRHLHALAARGQQALEELFPGLTTELVAHGVPTGDLLANGRWYLSGHRLRQAPTGLVLLGASRPFLESHVRARVRALPNLAFLDRCDILGLATTLDGLGFRFPASVRHRYERLDRFPDGLLVLGDAVASFNPIYGQGMSVAALEALTLRHHLQQGTALPPRRLFRDLARVVDVPWDMAAGGDLVFPGVQGRRSPKVRLVNAYLARLHAAAAHDAHLAAAFVRVAGLVAPPQSLLRPGIVLRVLRNGLGPAGRSSHRRGVVPDERPRTPG